MYNNLLALPLMVGYMVVGTRELQEIRYFPQLDDPLFLVRPLLLNPDWAAYSLSLVLPALGGGKPWFLLDPGAGLHVHVCVLSCDLQAAASFNQPLCSWAPASLGAN